ncbi:MAG: hypothetical protein QG560_1087, partial [Campylobacterota bacterium]|nr:hypothetical protein [Campylobacterota bacterium]
MSDMRALIIRIFVMIFLLLFATL